MKLSKIIGLSLSLFFILSPLFAASITNNGKTAVKLTGKSATGIIGALTIQPGQIMPIRQKFLWIEHVPDGPAEKINLKIMTDSGATGYITSPGERYVFPDSADSSLNSKPALKLRPGYALNGSNVQMYISLTNRGGGSRTSVLLPSQTMTIPEDTVEVKTEPFSNSFGDQVIQIEIVMPDGKRHVVRSSNETVRIG